MIFFFKHIVQRKLCGNVEASDGELKKRRGCRALHTLVAEKDVNPESEPGAAVR